MLQYAHSKFQQVILYLFTAVLLGYGGYFLISVTIEGGESAVNYGAAGPLFVSMAAYVVAAFLSLRSEHHAAQVALIAAGVAAIALLATLCLVMGVFILFALFSPFYILAILYPYTAVYVSAMYARWVSTSSNSQAATISPLQWLVSSEPARPARVLLAIVVLWSMVMVAVSL